MHPGAFCAFLDLEYVLQIPLLHHDDIDIMKGIMVTYNKW